MASIALMKKNFFVLLALAGLMTLSSGCYSTLDGRSKMGVPFSKDFIESRYERPTDRIFAAAKEVLAFNGTLTGENTVTKTLDAKIDTRTVWVKVDEVEPNISRVIVQARKKSGTSDIDLASEIDKQIALRLR